MGQRSSFAILYHPQRRQVLLHKRDAGAPVNPNKWALFGGLAEDEERPIPALIRELREELAIEVDPAGVAELCDYLTERGVHRCVFRTLLLLEKDDMRLGEGEGFDWFTIEQALQLDLTTSTRRDLTLFAGTDQGFRGR